MRGTTGQLERVFADCAFESVDEAKLQDEIARLLDEAGLVFAREVELGEGDRIDFLVEGSIGLEVKVKGSRSDVIRQLHRYAQHDAVEELMLATTRWVHVGVPRFFSGKPLTVIPLYRGCL